MNGRAKDIAGGISLEEFSCAIEKNIEFVFSSSSIKDLKIKDKNFLGRD